VWIPVNPTKMMIRTPEARMRVMIEERTPKEEGSKGPVMGAMRTKNRI